MKKILSLLALLVMTVTAFAADYVGHRTVTFGANPSTESEDAVLKITDNGNSTYNVTFENVINVDGTYTDNYGTYTFSNVAGTTTDGLTTIDLTGLTASITNCDFGLTSSSDCVLFAKFNAEKAYARLEASFWGATITTVFGTDDFSTGGGSTTDPVVDPTQPVDLVEAGYNPGGEAFLFHAPIDWNTQKLVAKVDLSTCQNVKADNEGVFTCGSENLEWNVDVFTFFKKENKTLQSYTGGVNTGQKTVDPTEPVYFELSKANGYTINGTLQTIEPSKLSQVFALSTIYVGGPSGDQASNATYNYVKVVPLDWTEPTEPSEPTVEESKDYTANAMTQYVAGEESDAEVQYMKDAKVKLEKYSDNTYTATLYGVVAGADMASLGDITLAGLVENDGVYTLTEPKDVTIAASGSTFDGKTYSVQQLQIMPNEDNILVKMIMGNTEDGSMLAYQFGEVFIPVTQNFTSEAHVTLGDATTDYTNAKVDLTEFMEDVYRLTYKNLTVGEQTGDFVIDNLRATVDADNNVTFSTDETDAEWGNTYKAFSDLTITAVKGAEGFENLVVKFTTEGANVVFGEALPITPETPTVTKVVEDGYAPAGNKFSFPFSCDFATQKLVWEVDFTNAGSNPNQLVFTIGTSDADLSEWETPTGGNAHFYYTKSTSGQKLVLHYLHKGKRVDVDNIAVNNVTTFTLDSEGFHVGDQLAVAADQMPKLYEGGKDFLFGSQEGKGRSNAVYNYVEVRPLGSDTPDTPFEAVTKTATDVAYTAFNGSTTNYEAKTIEVTEYEKDKYKVTYKQLSAGTTTLGDLTIDGVTATVGEDNVVTLSTEATEATWSNVDEIGAIYFGMSEGSTTAINGFAASYTLNDAQEIAKLNLTFNFDIKGTEAKVVFGEQYVPEVTVVTEKSFTDKLYMVGDEFNAEVGQATVTIKEMSDETNNMTVAFVTEEGTTELSVPSLTKTVDAEKNRTTYTGTLTIEDDDFNVTALVYTEGETEKIYMVAEGSYYKYVVGTNPDATEVTEVSNKTYTSNLRVYDADSQEEEPVNVVEKDEAVVNIVKYSDDTYKVTLKDVAWGENPATDLVFLGTADSGIMPGELDGEDETAQRTSIVAVPDDATAAVLGEGVQAMFEWQEKAEDAIEMAFYLQIGETTYAGEFNYEKTPEEQEPFCKENYVADGNGFEWEINVDWDTQKIVMSIDPSTCTGNCEHIIGLGAAPTTFHGNLHLYRTSADQMLQGYFETSAGNNNTGKFAETTPFLVEVSKAQGFVVNDEVKIAASAMSDLFTLSTVKMGTGEGNNQLSRATYNYVKVVDKDWTAPKDPETGIGAIEAAYSDAQIFTVNGVKLNKLQKGLNIVRTADGKVKKVLVK